MENRLADFMQIHDLTPTALAERIGVNPSAISHLLSARNKPSFDFLSKLFVEYPDLNPRWLILGEGNMNLVDSASSILSPGIAKDNLSDPPVANERSLRDNERSQPKPIAHSKEIDRVIIFYSDGSFGEYSNKG